MGINRTAGRRSSVAQRLAFIATQLECKKRPWYVTQPGGRTPAQGWWWTPQSAAHPEFLGHNRVLAEHALQALLDAHYRS